MHQFHRIQKQVQSQFSKIKNQAHKQSMKGVFENS